ncbi:MAG: hypothetical protein ACP5GX_05225 [Anaerolineae bacterium]
MKPRTMSWLIFAMILMLTLVNCSPAPSEAAALSREDVAPPPTPGTVPMVGPQEVVADFYADYLAYESNPLSDGWYHTHEAVSLDWAAAVDEILASFDKAGYDPFLCAQDKPERVIPGQVTISGDKAVVDVESTFEGHAFTVELRRVNTCWQITNVVCIPQESATDPIAEESSDIGDVTEGWQTFRDEVFGFEFRYPAEWTTTEVELDVPDRPPAGKMERLVNLTPSGWNRDFFPLSFEVYTLSSEEFQVEHIPGDTREQLNVNGISMVKEVYDYGNFYAVQYTFESPVKENLRVVWYDYFTGWPDRVAGHEVTAELLEPILASFRFTE